MENYFDAFKINCSPMANENCTFTYAKVRITVLGKCLVRVEKTNNGKFCDEPTQSVWFRNFELPKIEKKTNGSNIIIKTEGAEFSINLRNGKMNYVKLSDGRKITDYKSGNLKGTRRTLDQTFGAVKIGNGIISKDGVAVLCDSNSLVIKPDGTIMPRESNGTDLYYFAYGYNYTDAVADLFKLTGKAPLVPRFSLGNWWSRYKAYTQDEYTTLMQRFIDDEIPITVATVDMDWHWVDIKKKFGPQAAEKGSSDNFMGKVYDAFFDGGWTGYSWNTDLFPDPQGFLKWLKDRNFKVTLNLHPATGVRWFEDSYKNFAEFMGDSPDSKKQYPFDITDKKYVEGYFKILHKPHQDMGVDFWWIDWQQGSKTKIPGLDPLWALNHYHSMDIARDGDRRPLILSRFAGAGSQRYPLGFSGDTAQTWAVLDFQPYFTSTASNIGYTWWSHDIGGHHHGYKNDELYIRWVQYGVFSPIMRLHSTANEFMGKEPWKFSEPVCRIATDFLRLRHRLLPYIYTMNYRTHHDGKALCEPMYYHYPKEEEAYCCPNEYFFGSELIVAPITTPRNKHTLLGGVEVWLPNGRYTDIFNGRIYEGNRKLPMFRDDASIPVLAREGAIIPLDMNDKTNDCSNPENMEILIYRGNNEFTMYEDDGETMNYQKGECAFTKFAVSEKNNSVMFSIDKIDGDSSVVPSKRNYKLSFKDIVDADITVSVNGNCVDKPVVCKKGGFVSVCLESVKPNDEIVVKLEDVDVLKNGDEREMLIELISKFQGENGPKAKKYTDYVNGKKARPSLPPYFRYPLKEIEKLTR